MSVLVFLDHADGQVKKNSLEAACYAAKIAELAGQTAEGVMLGNFAGDASLMGRYGLKKIYQVNKDSLNDFDAEVYTKVLADVIAKASSKIVVFTNNFNGKAVAPRLSVRLKAGMVSGAVALPVLENGFVVKKSVFSGKAFANVSIKSEIKIISLNTNAYKIEENENTAEVKELEVEVPAGKVKVKEVNKVKGEIPLSEASIVVSGGRGLKGPENWQIVTDLAKALGAATACSRPVSDSDWRPHHEHVGQTGLAIAPDLYIAIGISGAIQHLAGVNRSKTIVVINKDPEAPFFKAADYGIAGDAFEVVPKITAAVKELHS